MDARDEEEGTWEAKFKCLQQEYEDYRATSKEMEEALQLEIEDEEARGTQKAQQLQAELAKIHTKRRSELQKEAAVVEQMEKEVAVLKEKAEEARQERVRLEIDNERLGRAERQLTNAVQRKQVHEEQLLEEVIMLRGEFQDSQDSRRAVDRNAEHQRQELEDLRAELRRWETQGMRRPSFSRATQQQQTSPLTPQQAPPGAEGGGPAAAAPSPAAAAGADAASEQQLRQLLRSLSCAVAEVQQMDEEWAAVERRARAVHRRLAADAPSVASSAGASPPRAAAPGALV